MTRRARTARPVTAARPRAAAGRRGLMALAAAGATLAVLVAVMLPRLRARPAPAPGGGPADALDIAGAYQVGARLYHEKRCLEAVPYFRRLGALLPAPSRDYHLQFADVLEHAALQGHPGVAQYATRSSAERVALVREALAHLDQAERLSETPRGIAEVRAWRSSVLRVWGFPWEALAALRAAQAADPTWTTVGRSADLFVHRLRHPEVSIPGLDDDTVPGVTR